ncbi:MAG: TetR/AcrR family transcriptional regulator [Cyanobacteria bacterium J06621_11]
MAKKVMAKKATYHHGDLRQALLKAALELLKIKDAKSISLREVARTAGVSHTAPYRHFEDKAALLAAIAKEGFIEFGDYLKAAVEAANARPVESLQATGIAYVRYALDHPTHFRVMFGSFPADEPADSELYCVSKGTFQILVDIIKSGQAAGLMRAGDPEFLALGKWSMVHGLAMLLLDGMLPTSEETSLELVQALVSESMKSLVTSEIELSNEQDVFSKILDG